MNSNIQVDISGLTFCVKLPVGMEKLEIVSQNLNGGKIDVFSYTLDEDYKEVEGHLRCVLSEWSLEHPNGGIVYVEFTAIGPGEQRTLPSRLQVVISQPMIAGLLPRSLKAA